MSNKSHSLAEAAATQCHAHREHVPPSTTTAAFTIVQLTDALLPLLEPVEAASYPASYCEGVAGYAKRLHATPPCPSFVCLQRIGGSARVHAEVADLIAAGDLTALRAIGYAVTCRMPRRTASLLLRDSPPDGEREKAAPKKIVKGSEVNCDGSEEDAEDDCTLVDNHAVHPLTEAEDHLPAAPKLHADALYVHDVAVHPDFRGLGVAAALWRQVEQTRVTLQLKRMSLVAVFGANTYWARHGFREVARKTLPVDTVRVLDDYGDHAVFMERED